MNLRRLGTSVKVIPVFILLGTILLLTLILASIGQRSLKRERALLLDLKGRQAEFIVKSLASASRISVLMLDPSSRHLERFVNDTAQAKDVAFIAVYRGDGHLIASSHRFQPDVHGLSPEEFERLTAREDQAFFLEDYPEFGRLYVLVSRYFPFDSSWMHLRMLGIPEIPGVTEEGETADGSRVYFGLVGMGTEDLEKTVGQGMRQALLNGFLLLLLGTIGFYFLILVQGYYSARRALADVRQYTIDVIDGMAEGLINIDSEGILRTVNPEAEEMLGKAARDIVGKPWNEVLTGEEWGRVSRYLSGGLPFYDLEIPPGESSRPYLSVTMIPVRGQDEAGGMVLFLRDMGELKSLRMEVRRSERLAALGRLVAGMAHEIRNPLNSIRGFSQHLQGRLEPGSSERRSADTIVREVDRLNRVITELLDFSRPREPIMEHMDLNQVVRSMAGLVEREATSQGVKCVDELDQDPVYINGDEDAVKQLLLNLFLNAIQAMPDGGVLTLKSDSGRTWSTLTVGDTGTGIHEEDQEKIFDPFYTTKEGGIGLGLSIAHRIVLDHDGEIRVQSSHGRGTEFIVRFPAARGR
ncbi:MAG: PAS domain-containing protein [bacterium]|nr:MAG: PAS domain-containing protein [bacterium]